MAAPPSPGDGVEVEAEVRWRSNYSVPVVLLGSFWNFLTASFPPCIVCSHHKVLWALASHSTSYTGILGLTYSYMYF